MDISNFFCILHKYSTTKNTITAGQAGMVCESNHISGRKQKPAGNREEVLTNIFCWNPFPLGDGGCQSLVLGYALAEKWGIFMETYTNKTGKNPFDVRADAGITWLLVPNFQLDLSGGLGISKISHIGFIVAGLSWRIPR